MTERPAEPSTADLVRQAATQISTLVRDEIRLARAELTAKGKRLGIGAGLLGGAGIIALYGAGAVLAAVILAINLVLPAWAAALIVGGALLLFAGLLALIGGMATRRAMPPMPEATVRSVREDIDSVSHAMAERGRR
ncbi:MAG TPA: phage holin family protein [Micromonosporaceae bacterium]